MADFVEFVVMVKGKKSGLGLQRFCTAPRVGEYISFNDSKGIAQAYEVIAVFHAFGEDASGAGDLILKHVGEDAKIRAELLGLSKPKLSVV